MTAKFNTDYYPPSRRQMSSMETPSPLTHESLRATMPADTPPLLEVPSVDMTVKPITYGALQVTAPKTMPPLQCLSQSDESGKAGTRPARSIQRGSKPTSYVELYELMNPDKPETEEERGRREKHEKGEAVLAAVGDGISALSNLWFTSRYGPNAYNAANGMSAANKARWEKLRQEREAKRKEYNDGYMRAQALDEAKAREDRNWRHTLEREKITDEKARKKDEREDRKAEQQELIFQVKYALQLGKLTEQGYRNAIAEIKAGTMQELTEATINRLNRTGVSSGGGKGGSGVKTSPWQAFNPDTGETITINATSEANAWSNCPEGFVIRQKPTETTTTTEVTDHSGRPKKKTTKTTRKNSGNVGGNKGQNMTMPGVGGSTSNKMPGVK